ISLKLSNMAESTPLSCGNGMLQSAIKYSISTKTRYLIKASSEKKGANSLTLFLYLPSIGEMAFSSDNDIFGYFFSSGKDTVLICELRITNYDFLMLVSLIRYSRQ